VISRRRQTLHPSAIRSYMQSKPSPRLRSRKSPGEHVINDSSLIAGVLQYDNDEDDGTNDDIETIHPESEGNDTESYATNEENDDDNENIILPDDEDDYMPEYALEPEQNKPTVRRSERFHRPPVIYEPTMHGQTCEPTIRGSTHTQVTPAPTIYTTAEAMVLARIISEFNERLSITTTGQGSSFVTTYSLQKGLQQFRYRGKQATPQEMQQLHDRNVFNQFTRKHSAIPCAHERWNRSSFLQKNETGGEGTTLSQRIDTKKLCTTRRCVQSNCLHGLSTDDSGDRSRGESWHCHMRYPQRIHTSRHPSYRCRWQSYYYENPREARGHSV
jgi:hypothetical protein